MRTFATVITNKKTMKKMMIWGAALLTTVSMTGCRSGKNVLPVSQLAGEWNITTVNNEEAKAEKRPYLVIDLTGNRLYGCAGCNRIMGTVQTENNEAGKISFGKVGSTRMLCPDTKTETAVLQALAKVEGYKGTEENLVLTDANGNSLLTLEKRPAMSMALLEGEWEIIQVYGVKIKEIGDTGSTPFLAFNTSEKSVHGHTGCNIINGAYKQEKDSPASLQFGDMACTMMAGPGMEVEGKVLDAINHVKSFSVKDKQTAILYDENGEEALTLKKK